MDEDYYILIANSLNFVHKSSIVNKSAMVKATRIGGWTGDKLLSETILIRMLDVRRRHYMFTASKYTKPRSINHLHRTVMKMCIQFIECGTFIGMLREWQNDDSILCIQQRVSTTPVFCAYHVHKVINNDAGILRMLCSQSYEVFKRCSEGVWHLDWNIMGSFSKTLCHENAFRITGPLWGNPQVNYGSPHKGTVMSRFEWLIEFNGLCGDSGQRGPYSPYKSCNHSLYIGIIIFPHIDNPQYESHNLL